MKPKTLPELFPDVDFYLHRGVIADPPMCFLADLSNGSLSIDDIHLMHELLDLRQELQQEKNDG